MLDVGVTCDRCPIPISMLESVERWLPKFPQWRRFYPFLGFVIGNVLITVVYTLGVWFSIDLASLPGHISPLWAPSAFTFALVYVWGWRTIPGIALGSLIGISGGLLQLIPSMLAPGFIFIQLSCVAGNLAQPFLGVWLLRQLLRVSSKTDIGKNPSYLFGKVNGVCAFIVASLLSPIISAILGITTAYFAKTIPPDNIAISFVTWWSNSALAHLIFTPTLLLFPPFFYRLFKQWKRRSLVINWLLLPTIILGAIVFRLALTFPVRYLFFLLLIFIIFNLGNVAATCFVSIVCILGILSSNYGFIVLLDNPTAYSVNSQLIFLQSFMAALSLTALILNAVLEERKNARQSLYNNLNYLEEQIVERTAALQQSEAQINGFFASASMGMGIFDRHFNLVRNNAVLARMLGGGEIQENAGDLFQNIPQEMVHLFYRACEEVLASGQALLNQELEIYGHHGPTWLVSYFPIFDLQNHPQRVGFIMLDVSDRKRLERQLQEQAKLDGLTKIANRRFFEETLAKNWKKAMQHGQPLSLILCDADYFKAYNDHYGHPMGDTCLISIAHILNLHMRQTMDLAARYGGEEFAIVLANTDAATAKEIAEHIREDIHECCILHEYSSVSKHVTLSMGIATCYPQSHLAAEMLIKWADEALYQAKSAGRDRIMFYEHPRSFSKEAIARQMGEMFDDF